MSLTISWPSSGACSSTSTRAQSMVSLHRRQLLQIQRADFVNEADHLLAQRLRNAGHAALDDAFFQLLLGKADVQMQAAPLQGVAEIALAVRGQDHGRRARSRKSCRVREW